MARRKKQPEEANLSKEANDLTSPNESLPLPEEVKPEVKVEARHIDYSEANKLLELKNVKQYFRFKTSGRTKYLKAVHDVSFDVYKGEVFGLVGESGCGKTTTGRDILRLYPLTSGSIYFKGVRIAAGTRWNEKEIKWVNIRSNEEIKKLLAEKKALESGDLSSLKEGESLDARFEEIEEEIASLKAKKEETRNREIQNIKDAHRDNRTVNKRIVEKEIELISAQEDLGEEDKKELIAKAKKITLANKIQMIFQDPIASLNPRMTVRDIIAEGLIINGIRDKKFIDEEVARVLTLVGLVPEHATRYPHEFSGGQRQRIGIARAIIMHPELIVADEPVSALDVSVQAQVINLLNNLRDELGLTLVFIAHNLSVVKYFCDRIAVMYYGNLVELASSDELFKHPLHPYTKSLLSAVPIPDPITEKNRKRIIYNPFEAHDYSKEAPSWREIVSGHYVRANSEEAAKYIKELKA